MRFASISCTAGMSESQLLGRALPTGDPGQFTYCGTPFPECYESGSLFLFDEIDAVALPGDAREHWRIIQDFAAALGRPHGLTFDSPREILEELGVASGGGVVDYAGMTWEKYRAEPRRLAALLPP